MAAQFSMNTQDVGESESTSPSKPSLKECFCDLPDIYNKLIEQGMVQLDDLLFVTENELDAWICNIDILNLKGMKKNKI